VIDNDPNTDYINASFIRVSTSHLKNLILYLILDKFPLIEFLFEIEIFNSNFSSKLRNSSKGKIILIILFRSLNIFRLLNFRCIIDD